MAAALTGDWTGMVVICAATPWDGTRLLDQHIATHLAQYAPVLYVDPPVSHISARRSERAAASIEAPRLRAVGDRIARVTPLVLPAHQRPGMKAVTVAITRQTMRRAMSALGGGPAQAVIVTTTSPLFGVCGEKTKVFYAKDDYVAGAQLMRIATSRIRREASRMPRIADVVVAASPALAQTYTALGFSPILLPNGCDAEGLAGADAAPLPADVSLPSPIAGFVGHLSNRIDLGLLERVADRGTSLLLVGPRQSTFEIARIDRLLARPNVQWVGAKSYAELPGYLRMMDVGLVPYADSSFNQASFPLKMLEYLAAGRPVISTDLSAARWLDTRFVQIASADAFADAVGATLAAGDSPGARAARREFAAEHSWQSRVATLAHAIGITTHATADTGQERI